MYDMVKTRLGKGEFYSNRFSKGLIVSCLDL